MAKYLIKASYKRRAPKGSSRKAAPAGAQP